MGGGGGGGQGGFSLHVLQYCASSLCTPVSSLFPIYIAPPHFLASYLSMSRDFHVLIKTVKGMFLHSTCIQPVVPYFTPVADLFIPAPTRGTRSYSFRSELGCCGDNGNDQTLKRYSNPSSLDCESGILPLSDHAPHYYTTTGPGQGKVNIRSNF